MHHSRRVDGASVAAKNAPASPKTTAMSRGRRHTAAWARPHAAAATRKTTCCNRNDLRRGLCQNFFSNSPRIRPANRAPLQSKRTRRPAIPHHVRLDRLRVASATARSSQPMAPRDPPAPLWQPKMDAGIPRKVRSTTAHGYPCNGRISSSSSGPESVDLPAMPDYQVEASQAAAAAVVESGLPLQLSEVRRFPTAKCRRRPSTSPAAHQLPFGTGSTPSPAIGSDCYSPRCTQNAPMDSLLQQRSQEAALSYPTDQHCISRHPYPRRPTKCSQRNHLA